MYYIHTYLNMNIWYLYDFICTLMFILKYSLLTNDKIIDDLSILQNLNAKIKKK